MKQTLSKFSRCTLLALIAGLPWSAASAQAIKVEADSPAFEELISPEFSATKNKKFKPKGWLEIETKINVKLAPAPKSETCDRLTVKWFLAVQNPEKANTLLLITKEVHHVNIPLGEDIYCSAYLSPASIRRILGSNNNVAKVVEHVGFEVLYNGEIVATGSNKLKPGWWKIASPSISQTDLVTLMDKPETPFSHMWWDRYAEVDASKR